MNLRHDAMAIWKAGVDGVLVGPLVKHEVEIESEYLCIENCQYSRDQVDRVVVVGAGKAGAAMAGALRETLGDWCPVTGWVNVPEGTEQPVADITIHPARPAGANEPTQAGVVGTQQIMQMVSQAGPSDLVIVLISGGGSALLPLPREGVSLDDKLKVTRTLSGAGADIVELNTVRKHLSQIKGGGLARACQQASMITLVLSDVLGDPLGVIASGPTAPDSSTPSEALEVLAKYDPDRHLPGSIYRVLGQAAARETTPARRDASSYAPIVVIGNNAVAVDAAGIRAESLGYNHVMQSARWSEGAAETVGRHLAEMTLEMLDADSRDHRNDCLISGGEPTVSLVESSRRGKGGRNQQLVLAAYQWLTQQSLRDDQWDRLAILSGGTDGEDGPTDAAGAVIDAAVHQRARQLGLDPADYLARNDAYEFFRQVDGLLITGPTGTNVCDIRVCLVKPAEQ